MPEKTAEELKQEEKTAMQTAESELEEKVNKNLQAAFGDESIETDEAGDKSDDDSTSDSVEDESKTDDSKTDESKEDESETEQTDESDKSESDSTSQKDDSEGDLPDAYVRAAIHQGWNEEEVKEFYQADPEKAKKTFGNIYNSTNKLSKEFARLGKTTIENQQQQEQPKETTEKQEDFIDIAKLKEEYPDDPLIDQVIAPMNEALGKLNKQQQTQSQSQLAEQQQETQANAKLEKAIVEFFDSGNLDNYSEIYGKIGSEQTWDDLTVNQQKKRWNVLNTADQVLSGAAVQGKDMAIDEALNLAHMLVTEDMREQAIRNDIKKQVSKRSNSVSLKPGGDSSATTDEKPVTDKQLEGKVANKLKQVFG